MSLEARAEILGRIRSANSPSLPRTDVGGGRSTLAPALSLGKGEGDRLREVVVDQFAEYAAEYRAHVSRIREGAIGAAIARRLAERGISRAVIPPDFPEGWLPEGVEFVRDYGFGHGELNEMPSVVTACALAVAETGTIVLDAGSFQGRRAISLIPDHHICLVFEYQVVDSVEEAVELLGNAVREGRPLTWISGPSATSDIELDRVEGVHGPRNLDIVLVAAER